MHNIFTEYKFYVQSIIDYYAFGNDRMPTKNNVITADLLQKFSYPQIKTPPKDSRDGFCAYKDGFWSYLRSTPPTTTSLSDLETKRSGLRSERMANLTQHRQFLSAPATGWKFQISLDDSNPQNVEDAWNKAILPCLLKYGVSRSKIYSGQEKLSELENGAQDGKQVTVYTSLNKDYTPEDWQALLQEINELLVKHNIQPGPRAQGKTQEGDFFDLKAIKGSSFITYQYDAGQTGYSDFKSQELPPGVKDIYADIGVDVAGQPPPKARSPQKTASKGAEEDDAVNPIDNDVRPPTNL